MDDNDKLMGVLSYIPLVCLVPAIVGKNSFVKFHANQGLVLFILELVFSVCIGIFVKIPILGVIFGIVGGLIDLICLILAIIGIVTAINGETKELPVIGVIHILK